MARKKGRKSWDHLSLNLCVWRDVILSCCSYAYSKLSKILLSIDPKDFSDKRLLPYFNWHSLATFDIISEFKQFLKVSLLEDNTWFYNVEVINKLIFLKWLCHSNKLAFDEENSKAFWKKFWITFVKFASSH